MNTLVVFVFAVLAACSYGSYIERGPVEKTHLVTMRKAELMEIVNCVSELRNSMVCKMFAECEDLMAKPVIMVYEHCLKEILHSGRRTCNAHQPLFPSPAIPPQIFDCVASNSPKLTPEERGEMVEFEVCSRKLYTDNCKAPKYHY